MIEDLKHVMRLDLKKIRRMFLKLQSEVRESLRQVPLQELIRHVLGYVEVFELNKTLQLIPEENLRHASSSDEVFDILQKLWNFLEYDMLISVVEHCGDKAVCKKVQEYHNHLKEFFEMRKLSEIPEGLSLSTADETCDLVVMKLDLTDPTLREIKDLKSKVCEILEIMPSTLLIAEIRQGCVEVTFLIQIHVSEFVFAKTFTAAQREAFRAASVLKFTWRHITETFVSLMRPKNVCAFIKCEQHNMYSI